MDEQAEDEEQVEREGAGNDEQGERGRRERDRVLPSMAVTH